MPQVNPAVRTSLRIETPKSILVDEELALVTAALAHNPGSRKLRFTQADLLQRKSQLCEAGAILSDLATEQREERVMLRLALINLAKETPEGDAQAVLAAEQVLALTDTDLGRANALTALGKAQVRLCETASAEACFLEALALIPDHKDAFKRFAALKLKADEPEVLLEHIARLQALGVGHSRLLGALGLAHLRIGNLEGARHIFGADTLLYRATLTPPSGWSLLSDFNEAVVAEMSSHPSLRFESPGSASRKTWRVDNPATRRSDVIPQLQARILAEITDYIDTLAALDHPWVRACPEKAELHNWCVMTDGEGFEEWHVHQFGWLSGVYYAGVPDSIINGEEQGGCIAFGVPSDLAGPEVAEAFGTTLVRPEAGLLMLFPSHLYHRTFPHFEGGRRTCVAFDLKPL